MIKFYHSLRSSFLQNLNFQIEEHLCDHSLTVHRLLRLIAMSRTDLHRKLVFLTGMSITKYIRNVRLYKAAALLLKEEEWTVYQVAFEVGFNSPSYFTKRFHELFGVSPAEWRQGSLEQLL